MMRKRIPLSQREDYDVLAEFDGNEDTADDSAFLKDRGMVARSAGLTLVLMIVTAIAFALGVAWGASQDVNVAPGNAVWDLVIHIGFALGIGLLASAAVAALVMLGIGIPYAWGKISQTRARNSAPGRDG